MHETSGSLEPRAPFDFTKSLRFMEGFSPTEGEQAIAEGAVRKAVRIDGKTLLFEVRSPDGSPIEHPELRYTLWSEPALRDDLAAAAAARIGAFLSIDDVREFYELARPDVVLSPHVDRLFGLHQVRFLTPFENACWAVMGQRAPIPMARRAKDTFVERFGGTIRVGGVDHRAFPEPADVAGLTPEDLRHIVRDDRRASYLANVIDAWQEVDETWLHTGPIDDVSAWLRGSKVSASGPRRSSCSAGSDAANGCHAPQR